MLRLAHLSDLHIAPLSWPSFTEFFSKRWVGFCSWHFKRRFIHRQDMAEKLIADVQSFAPDHIAFTGDLLNLSARREFLEGKKWLSRLGSCETVSFVPGNHDAYVRYPESYAEDLWGAYTLGNFFLPPLVRGTFPYVRQIRNVALIGLSSACPEPIGSARGELGHKQLDALAHILPYLRQNGFYRVILIHHPPLLSLQEKRKNLKDFAKFEEILQKYGAELVLCGHAHKNILKRTETAFGPSYLSMVSSASSVSRKAPASWNLFCITRRGGEWVTEGFRHTYSPYLGTFRRKALGELY